jgi:hypothetical protein
MRHICEVTVRPIFRRARRRGFQQSVVPVDAIALMDPFFVNATQSLAASTGTIMFEITLRSGTLKWTRLIDLHPPRRRGFSADPRGWCRVQPGDHHPGKVQYFVNSPAGTPTPIAGLRRRPVASARTLDCQVNIAPTRGGPPVLHRVVQPLRRWEPLPKPGGSDRPPARYRGPRRPRR